MQRFAAQAALAAAVFKQSFKCDDDGRVTYERLTNAILHEASRLDKATARGIAAVLCGGMGANDGVTLKVHVHPNSKACRVLLDHLFLVECHTQRAWST